jgi:chromosome segregation ATPase
MRNTAIRALTTRVAQLESQVQEYERQVEQAQTKANAMALICNEIEQMIAEVFPDQFPLYADDPANFPPEVIEGTIAPRCIGEHVPQTMVQMLIDEVLRLRERERETGIDGGNDTTP